MGWKEAAIIDQRVRFISEYLEGYSSFMDLCDQFEISRKTSYKWVRRYQKCGAASLADRSRKPHHCPHQTDEKIVQDILRMRTKQYVN